MPDRNKNACLWVLLFAGAVILASCEPAKVMNPVREAQLKACTSWEYKTLYAQPLKTTSRNLDGGGEEATSITPKDDELTKEGQAGWEMVSTYLEPETGYLETDKQILPNVRPQRLVMIFKRLTCPK